MRCNLCGGGGGAAAQEYLQFAAAVFMPRDN
jgi:hypothetical protein